MSQKLHLTWQDIEQDAKTLADMLRTKRIGGMLCITRGGLAPALLLSQHLDIKNIETIGVESYTKDNHQKDIYLIKDSLMIPEDGKNWIAIDDLSDTGNTFTYIKKRFSKIETASLYTKPNGKSAVDYVAREMPDQWIVFPWENE